MSGSPVIKLHAESQALVDAMAKVGVSANSTVEESRQGSHAMSTGPAAGNYHFDGTRKELFIPIPGSSETLPIYVYTPSNVAPNPAILIFYHGGGTVIGNRLAVEKTCQILAFDAHCLVVNVEYRLSPEHPFPVFLDDGCTAARWVLANKFAVGGTQLSKVGIGGDSAGGMISASVAHDVKGLAFQVLIYPRTVGLGPSANKSYEEFRNGPILTADLLNWFDSLTAKPADYKHPRLASTCRPSFNKLPPAQFIVAQYDPVRDDSHVYAKLLREAGVPVDFHQLDGAVHIFYTLPGAFPQLTKDAYAKTVAFIKKWGSA